MSSPFFKPRAITKPKPKPNSTQHVLPHASSSIHPIHPPPSTSTSTTPATKPKFNEDYTSLFSLALSDYALWADSDLRRALDFSRESDEEGDGGFVPLTQLLKRSKVLAPLALEKVQVQIVKALRAEGKMDARLLVSEPSASTWGGQAPDRRDLGAASLMDIHSQEDIQSPQRTLPSILHFFYTLLSKHPTSPNACIQALTFPPHHQDKPNALPTCKAMRARERTTNIRLTPAQTPTTTRSSFPVAVFHLPPTEPEAPVQPSPRPSRRNSASTNDNTTNTSNDRYREFLVALPSPTGSFTELGIMSFGKRMRIPNAITDLRSPPSSTPTTHPTRTPPCLYPPPTPRGTRATSPEHTHTTRSPGRSVVFLHLHLHRDSPETGYAPSPEQVYAQNNGINDGNGELSPEPAQIGLSVSAPAINGKGANEEEEDRDTHGINLKSEAVHSTSMRCRLFGRSYDSTSSKLDSPSRHSKEGSFSASASSVVVEYKKDKNSDKDKSDKEKEKDRDSLRSLRPRSKKRRIGAGERLSIFWSTFSGTLGKERKPPPRYSAAINATHVEKPSHSPHSVITLPRLTSSSRNASGHDRPPSISTTGTATPKPTPKSTPKSTYKQTPVGSASPRDPALLRKRTSSAPAPPTDAMLLSLLKQGQSILQQIGDADFRGWMRKKGDRCNSWKLRYFVLKGPDLYCLKSNGNAETKIKGYVNIMGYKVTVDENVDPGRYGFRIEHDNDKTHYFSSDEKSAIRDWMKVIMKATIGRDYTSTDDSHRTRNILLQYPNNPPKVNPAPRPPSPTARAAIQKALRRENTNQLSTRDARVPMGLPLPEEGGEERARLTSFFARQEAAMEDGEDAQVASAGAHVEGDEDQYGASGTYTRLVVVKVMAEDTALFEWANAHLPLSLLIRDATGSLYGGLALLRIAESVKSKPASPPVLDSAFPQGPADDKLDGLFQLFDFLLDNQVKMGSVCINGEEG
ncbi:hypothetical protein DXG01_002737 [Tephrocybe rancida]|nr:hypothetical protein DXG01_002737 [Tephrocybe rancida]